MIFLNRRRTIISTDAPIIKDPSKYWYVEKYVYGELKETVEVPLGTGTKFTGIESGYEDDWFEGWSKSSTSTTRTFNATTTYKNTTTAVKNLLDSDKTIKIYAVYKYSTKTTKSVSVSNPVPSMANNGTHYESGTLLIKDSGTITVSGYETMQKAYMSSGQTGSFTTTYNDIDLQIKDKYGNKKSSITVGHNNSSSKKVEIGDKLYYSIQASYTTPSASSGSGGSYIPSGDVIKISSKISISNTGYMYDLSSSPKYRVVSHT